MFLGKGVLQICITFTGEHQCRNNVISIKLLCNFIEITLQHGCSPVSLLHIFRTSFRKNTSGWLLLPLFKNYCFSVLKGQIIKTHKNQIYFKTFKFEFFDTYYSQSTLHRCHSAVITKIIFTKILFYCSDSYESLVLLGYSHKRK